jgi:pimeloyl-ACP methyl ester carboxylesterase
VGRSWGYLPRIHRPVTLDAALALARTLGAIPARAETEELAFEDAPTTVYGSGDPDIILLNGATPLGRRHPALVRLATALASTGRRVLVPDVYGIDRGEVGERGVAAAVCVAEAARARFAFFGVSVGTTLGLLAAQREPLAERVSVVAGTAGYVDLQDLIRTATTERFESSPFLFECVERSVRATATGKAVDALLANRDPARFGALYAALPSEVRAAIERLSPAHGAEGLLAPVLILADPSDKYFPPEHVARLPEARVTSVTLLSHADVGLNLRNLPQLARVLRFLARALKASRSGR